jgi:hypothetical protein
MPTFQLLPGAMGVDLPDGRSIKADRRGRIVVDDDAARQIAGSSAMHRYDSIIQVAPGRFASAPEAQSCHCGFVPWPWTTVCPRCGDPLGGR